MKEEQRRGAWQAAQTKMHRGIQGQKKRELQREQGKEARGGGEREGEPRSRQTAEGESRMVMPSDF